MRANEFIHDDLEEGWKEKAAAAALALGVAGAPTAVQKATMPSDYNFPTHVVPARQLTHIESILSNIAKQSGIRGPVLAQLLAQAAHETGDFANMEEIGDKKYFLKRYWKNVARRNALGNKHPQDAINYRGRGFIQLTGRANYERIGNALGIDLLHHPELAAEPKTAAKIAVQYFKDRVQPKVDDFRDTHQVTKTINPHDTPKATANRAKNYKLYANLLGLRP